MKNATLKLLPLLLLYLSMVIMFSSPTFEGDEDAYVGMASRISQGDHSPSNHLTLWFGPGYPIVLSPFAYLKLPWLLARLLNAFFLFGAILYLYKTLSLWLRGVYALIFAFVLGLYPPFWILVHRLLTENLVFFLVCGFMFHFCKLHRESKSSWSHLLLASIFLSYLALTKVFFGYVILLGLLSFLILYLWQKGEKFKKTTYIYLLALIWCLPYLFYTYSLTGKVFYWGTSGGMSLYWMSTHYENEWGSWKTGLVQDTPELAQQHREFFNKIAGLSAVEKDSASKKQAIDNITRHPTNYLINWMANIGRLLFSYPFSHGRDRLTTYFYLIPNMFIVVLFILGIYPAILRWKSIPYEIFALLYFSLITFGGTSLLSAYDRQFRPLVPILLLWLSFLYVRVLKVEVRPESEIKSAAGP
jgi:4-amino-4-deoxy-L-arabinose transferase-like glycosyltransferase